MLSFLAFPAAWAQTHDVSLAKEMHPPGTMDQALVMQQDSGGSVWWPFQGQPWQQYQGWHPPPGTQTAALHAQWWQQCPLQTFSMTCLCGSGQCHFWVGFSYFPSGSMSGFQQLFLLKLSRSDFYRVPISILTDCTLHWLSAANPSGKQKPQPLPQTSLFLLRGNDLGSNLQLT